VAPPSANFALSGKFKTGKSCLFGAFQRHFADRHLLVAKSGAPIVGVCPVGAAKVAILPSTLPNDRRVHTKSGAV
jgi:hypothetical protein